jgi:VWFA-related protein
MMKLKRPKSLSVLLLGLSSLLAAQQLQHTAPKPTHTITLDVIVRNASDKTVTGLTKNDFTVLDNKVRQPVASFEAVTSKPSASMLIVIDSVNAPATAVSYQRNQIVAFLRANDGHLAQPTSIGILSDTAVRMSGHPTTNGNALADTLEHVEIGLRDIHRDSGFYGAEERMDISMRALGEIVAAENELPGRKLVVWVSPGWPLISGAEVNLTQKQQMRIFDQVVDYSSQLREKNIVLYDVNTWGADEAVGRALYYENFVKGVRKPYQTELGDLGLQVLALQSGGLVLNSNDAKSMLQQCAADAGAYYEISLEAPTAEGNVAYHALDITLDRPGMKARTRAGYYVRP